MEPNPRSFNIHGTESLCFDKNEFMKENFNVDTFVQVHQASGCGGLNALRDDLGVYLKILRSAMIDLINRDYADFVNLSTNLTGLDRQIDVLKTPLGQLREEVLSVEHMLTNAIDSMSNDLVRRHSLNQHKSLFHRLNQISVRLNHLESLLESRRTKTEVASGDELVNRIATEINHLNFLVAQCEGAALLDVFKPRVEVISNFVEVGLERGLREGIQDGNRNLLLRSLRTYVSLGTISHAHKQVRLLIRNQLEDVINDSALKSDPRGLKGMFDKTLKCINETCDCLLTLTQGSGCDTVSGYSFLEKSVWPEIVLAMATRTPHIFNPGNPTAFHERCEESLVFLDTFEELIGTVERVEAFRILPDYEKFLQLWNMPVYFQIRYQEIGQVLESTLSDKDGGLVRECSESSFILKGSHVTWQSLLKCFDSEIFLAPILHRFWKLLLLMLSRHRVWIESTTVAMKSIIGKGTTNDSSSGLRGLDAAVAMLHDIDAFASHLGDLYEGTILPWVEHLPEDKQAVMKDTLEVQVSKHLSLKDGLLQLIIDYLIEEVITPLRQVQDTPRLYRRTNRSSAVVHQPYVANSMSNLHDFTQACKDKISAEVYEELIRKVFTNAVEQYQKLTYEVLSSVYKMEESLKRLKRARDRGTQSGTDVAGVPTDDDKIRHQIYLDVVYFLDQVQSLGVSESFVSANSSSLLVMVTNAKEGKFVL